MKVKYTIHGSYGYRIHQDFTVCHPLDVLWTDRDLDLLRDYTLVILLMRSYTMGLVYGKWVPFNDPKDEQKLLHLPTQTFAKSNLTRLPTGSFFIHRLLTCHPFHQFWCPHLLILWARSWRESDFFWETPIEPRKEPLLLSIIPLA